MNSTQKTIALAISGAFALTIAATSVNAAENPFSAKSLSSGYQVADADIKMKDGKCGAGKCGASKKKAMEENIGEKTHDGSCSAEKSAEGKCSAEMKNSANTMPMEAAPTTDAKMEEGKCSAGKCGANMKKKTSSKKHKAKKSTS